MSLRSNVFRGGLLALALAGVSAPSFANGWHKFAPKNGGFSVDLPGQPRLVTKGAAGSASYIWIYGDKQRKLLLVASTSDYYGDVPPASEEFQRDQDGFLQQVKGRATSSKQGRTRGANGKMLPSSIFTFKTEAGFNGMSKLILDGDTVYMTVMMWRKESHAAGVRRRFMASFRLLPRTKPPKPQMPDAAE